jgi:hypothetical protein
MRIENELVEYIRDKKNNRCGVIKACKVDLGDRKEVFILHTKVHSKKDTFDMNMVDRIVNCRLEFMSKYSKNQNLKKRIKKEYNLSSKIIMLYADMTRRAIYYFKDCDVFRLYIECFDYLPNTNVY